MRCENYAAFHPIKDTVVHVHRLDYHLIPRLIPVFTAHQFREDFRKIKKKTTKELSEGDKQSKNLHYL